MSARKAADLRRRVIPASLCWGHLDVLPLGNDIFGSPPLVGGQMQAHHKNPNNKIAAVRLFQWRVRVAGQEVTPFIQWLDKNSYRPAGSLPAESCEPKYERNGTPDIARNRK